MEQADCKNQFNILLVTDFFYEKCKQLTEALKGKISASIPQKSINFIFCRSIDQFKDSLEKELSEQNTKIHLVGMIDMGQSQVDLLLYIMQQNEQERNLQIIHSFHVGVDKFIQQIKDQLSKLNQNKSEKPILVCNAKGSFSEMLAEYVLYTCLFHAKKTPLFLENQQQKNWLLKQPVQMIKHQTLSIIGYGNIGVQVAKYCKLMGMKILGLKKTPNQATDEQINNVEKIVGMDKFDEILETSDFVVNVLPHTPETENLFNLEKFQKMKKSAVFINIGRGESVVEEDLVNALNSEIIAGASLDVCKKEPLDKSSELWEAKNIQITFHCGCMTKETVVQSFLTFIENLAIYFGGKTMSNIVDIEKGY